MKTKTGGHKSKVVQTGYIFLCEDCQALKQVAQGRCTILHHWRLSKPGCLNPDEPHVCPCYEQQFGAETSSSLSQLGLSCDPVLSVMARTERGRSEHLCIMPVSSSVQSGPEQK